MVYEKNLIDMKIIQILIPLIILGSVLGTAASIKPIIVDDMPNPLNSGLQTIKLQWTIIDDNPRSYALFINNSAWKNDSVTSNVIVAMFSNAVGWYNITLIVLDFSGNRVHSNLFINISPVFPTSTIPITSGSSASSSYSRNAKASPGFEYISIISLLTIISIYLVIKRKKIK